MHIEEPLEINAGQSVQFNFNFKIFFLFYIYVIKSCIYSICKLACDVI